jgi:hypothetical protein
MPQLIAKYLSTLLDLNVTNAYQIIEPTGTHLVDIRTLRNNFPQARYKHENALNGLTRTLCNAQQGSTADPVGAEPPGKEQSKTLHRQSRKLLTSLESLMALDSKIRKDATQQQRRLCELLFNAETTGVNTTEHETPRPDGAELAQQQAQQTQVQNQGRRTNRKLSTVQYVRKFNMIKRQKSKASSSTKECKHQLMHKRLHLC